MLPFLLLALVAAAGDDGARVCAAVAGAARGVQAAQAVDVARTAVAAHRAHGFDVVAAAARDATRAADLATAADPARAASGATAADDFAQAAELEHAADVARGAAAFAAFAAAGVADAARAAAGDAPGDTAGADVSAAAAQAADLRRAAHRADGEVLAVGAARPDRAAAAAGADVVDGVDVVGGADVVAAAGAADAARAADDAARDAHATHAADGFDVFAAAGADVARADAARAADDHAGAADVAQAADASRAAADASRAAAAFDVADARAAGAADAARTARETLDDHVARGCSDVDAIAGAFVTAADAEEIAAAFRFASEHGTPSSRWALASALLARDDGRVLLEREARRARPVEPSTPAPLFERLTRHASGVVAAAVLARPEDLPALVACIDDCAPEDVAVAARGIARVALASSDALDDGTVAALVARLEALLREHAPEDIVVAVDVAAAIGARWPLPPAMREPVAQDLEVLARLVDAPAADALRVAAANARVDDAMLGPGTAPAPPLPAHACTLDERERAVLAIVKEPVALGFAAGRSQHR